MTRFLSLRLVNLKNNSFKSGQQCNRKKRQGHLLLCDLTIIITVIWKEKALFVSLVTIFRECRNNVRDFCLSISVTCISGWTALIFQILKLDKLLASFSGIKIARKF